MNHLREKWGARAKLSSSSSDLDGSAASLVGNKRRHAQSGTAAAVTAVAPVAVRRAAQTQRYEALLAWIQRSGLAVAARCDESREGDALDELYESLDHLEAVIKQELALLLPKWSTDEAPAQLCGSSIVDYMVVIGPDWADLSTQTFWMGLENVFEPTVIFAHPPQSQFSAESIEQFCFPRGAYTRTSSDTAEAEEFFVLVLSGGGDQGQSVQYACCLRKHVLVGHGVGGGDSGWLVPVCYVVVVSTPWISFFHQLLHHLAECHEHELSKYDESQSSLVPDTVSQHIDSLLTALNGSHLPQRGEELHFVWSLDLATSPRTFSCCRPRVDCGTPETVALLLEWATPLLLSALGVERVITTIGLLLVEMKVIVVSSQMPLLSVGTVGLAALLHPLAWAGPLISILPPALLEYLEAPVPLLCGVELLPDNFCLTKGTAILYMDDDMVRLHPDDLAQVGAIQFPGSEELSRQLRAVLDRLKQSEDPNSRVVAANFAMHRIRQHLQELLNLCSRVNPYNAYACMKQEQLSLSETLFLKVFMQSQMYQKYSDDQSCNSVRRTPSPLPEQLPCAAKRAAPLAVSFSLSRSIHDLFQIAVVGRAKSNTELSLEKDTYSDIVTSDSCPVELTKQEIEESQLNGNPSDSNEIEEMTHTTSVQENCFMGSQIDFRMLELEDRRKTRQSQSNSTDSKSHSTPPSPEKPIHSENYRLYQDTNSRSFPDVLFIQEQEFSVSRTELDGISSSVKPVASSTVALNQEDGLPKNVPGKSCAPSSHFIIERWSVRAKELAAVIKIQTVWRVWIRRTREERQKMVSRGLSFVSVQSFSESTYPTPPGHLSDLLSGTTLSILTERGRLLDVRLRLSEDNKRLEWYHRLTLRGAVDLADLQEVRARGGEVAITTRMSENLAFVVHPHRANEAMTFFQRLHGLVTNSPRTMPSPATSVTSSSSQQSAPTFQDFKSCEQPQALTNLSIQDLDEIDMDGGARPSFFTSDKSLRSGVVVLKHGRMGKPHLKYLMCDKFLQSISWVDPVITNAGISLPPSVSQHVPVADKKCIRFDDVTEILCGKQTRVFQRSTAGRSNANLCLSVITNARTLDIEAFSREDFEMLFEGFQAIAWLNRHSGRINN